MKLPFLQIDVFTERPCYGNPVAAVLDRDRALTTPQMQRLANWTNLSETIVLQPLSGNRYQSRIFTPADEIPFAGHPTVGGAHAALLWKLVEAGGFVQACGRGDVEITGSLDGVEVTMPRPDHLDGLPELDALSSALGTTPHDLKLLDIGPRWLVGRVETVDELLALEPDFGGLAAAERQTIATGTTLYALDGDTPHVRSFAPNHGIPEDPVCGSGNLCVAEHLRATELKIVGDSWTSRQGSCLGRDGHVHVSLLEDGATLGRNAVVVFEGFANL